MLLPCEEMLEVTFSLPSQGCTGKSSSLSRAVPMPWAGSCSLCACRCVHADRSFLSLLHALKLEEPTLFLPERHLKQKAPAGRAGAGSPSARSRGAGPRLEALRERLLCCQLLAYGQGWLCGKAAPLPSQEPPSSGHWECLRVSRPQEYQDMPPAHGLTRLLPAQASLASRDWAIASFRLASPLLT